MIGMGLVYACLLQLSNGIPRVCMSALQLVAPWNSSNVDMLRTISESIVKSAGSGSTSWRFFWKHHRKTCNFMNARFVLGVLFLFLSNRSDFLKNVKQHTLLWVAATERIDQSTNKD